MGMVVAPGALYSMSSLLTSWPFSWHPFLQGEVVVPLYGGVAVHHGLPAPWVVALLSRPLISGREHQIPSVHGELTP
jgi:hypothetical protein